MALKLGGVRRLYDYYVLCLYALEVCTLRVWLFWHAAVFSRFVILLNCSLLSCISVHNYDRACVVGTYLFGFWWLLFRVCLLVLVVCCGGFGCDKLISVGVYVITYSIVIGLILRMRGCYVCYSLLT